MKDRRVIIVSNGDPCHTSILDAEGKHIPYVNKATWSIAACELATVTLEMDGLINATGEVQLIWVKRWFFLRQQIHPAYFGAYYAAGWRPC